MSKCRGRRWNCHHCFFIYLFSYLFIHTKIKALSIIRDHFGKCPSNMCPVLLGFLQSRISFENKKKKTFSTSFKVLKATCRSGETDSRYASHSKHNIHCSNWAPSTLSYDQASSSKAQLYVHVSFSLWLVIQLTKKINRKKKSLKNKQSLDINNI